MMLKTITLDLDLGNAQEHEVIWRELKAKFLFLPLGFSAEFLGEKEWDLWGFYLHAHVYILRFVILSHP